jgi:hypothetical protein
VDQRGQAKAAGWIAPPHLLKGHAVWLGRTVGSAVGGVVGLEADHRAGQGAGDPVHGLDAGDHQPAELVQAARLDPSDDVVGPVTSSARSTPSSSLTARATRTAAPTSVWMST